MCWRISQTPGGLCSRPGRLSKAWDSPVAVAHDVNSVDSDHMDATPIIPKWMRRFSVKLPPSPSNVLSVWLPWSPPSSGNLVVFRGPRKAIWCLEFPAGFSAGEKFSITVELLLRSQHLRPCGQNLSHWPGIIRYLRQSPFVECFLSTRGCAEPPPALFHVFPTITLQWDDCYCSHFTEKNTEVQRGRSKFCGFLLSYKWHFSRWWGKWHFSCPAQRPRYKPSIYVHSHSLRKGNEPMHLHTCGLNMKVKYLFKGWICQGSRHLRYHWCCICRGSSHNLQADKLLNPFPTVISYCSSAGSLWTSPSPCRSMSGFGMRYIGA